jgi:hypothetical protein
VGAISMSSSRMDITSRQKASSKLPLESPYVLPFSDIVFHSKYENVTQRLAKPHVKSECYNGRYDNHSREETTGQRQHLPFGALTL